MTIKLKSLQCVFTENNSGNCIQVTILIFQLLILMININLLNTNQMKPKEF